MTRDKNSYDLLTRLVHAGEEPEAAHGAVEPSVVFSTNFEADPESVGFSAEGLSENSPYFYARWATPTVHVLETKLASIEGGEAALCFASGMGAISALLLGTLKQGDHLVLSDVCYAGVAELAANMLQGFGIEVTTADFSDLEAARAAMRPNTKLVWAETPCNPILRLTDIAAVAKIAHEGGAQFGVDATMASPIATQPLALGADWVAHSLTKYCNGHGDALGGAVIGRSAEVAKLRQSALIHFGGALNPFAAWLIRRGLHTLSLRMRAHEENALKVAQFLEKHPAVKRVIYPGLPSHPQYELAKQQMKNFSGMLTFQTHEDGKEVAKRFYRKLQVFTYAVSLGKQRSLIWQIPTQEILESSFHLSGKAEESYREYAGDGIFRVSIGLESPEDLCVDLEQALQA